LLPLTKKPKKKTSGALNLYTLALHIVPMALTGPTPTYLSRATLLQLLRILLWQLDILPLLFPSMAEERTRRTHQPYDNDNANVTGHFIINLPTLRKFVTNSQRGLCKQEF
jgi:hypothetical protein